MYLPVVTGTVTRALFPARSLLAPSSPFFSSQGEHEALP
jgi:hypothetical protein